MFIKCKKRGIFPLYVVSELIIAFILFFILLSAVKSWASEEIITKNKLSKDMALLIDTLYALPYDAYVVYPEDTSNYYFSFFNNKVFVKKKDYDVTGGIYPFIGMKGEEISKEFKNPKALYFYKIKGKVGVSDNRGFIEDFSRECLNLKTKYELKDREIIVDPDENSINLGKNIRDSFFGVKEDGSSNIVLTRIFNVYNNIESILEERGEKVDIVLGFEVYDGKDILIIQGRSEKRFLELRRFSCLIEKELKNRLEGINIIKKEENLDFEDKVYIIIKIPENIIEEKEDEVKYAVVEAIRLYYD